MTINITSGSNFDLSTLPFDVDNLTLTGSGNINAVGNSIANLIIGNSANNVIDGGTAGNDTLKGGKGNDTYLINHSGVSVVENLSEGIDIVQSSVDFTLGLNIENLTLSGTTATKAYGNILNNLITGNTLANIISGGGGKDTLVGGIGNDTYLISNTGVVITENSGQGTDIVESTVSFTLLADGLDNLTLTGSAIIGKGNGGSNIITGNSKNNILDGGTSVMGDTLIGGLGNDTYIVSGSADKIFESAGQGTDTVISSMSYTLSNTQELENLTITGTADTAIGNSLTNIITGNSLNNTLSPGGDGNDTLIGGKGNDGYFVLNSSIVVKENFGEGTDTVLSNVSYTLTNNVENVTLANITGAIIGAGNSLKNVIIGNTFDNIISSGGGGKDTLYGGIGNDTYLISNTGVTITENSGQGTDIVESTVSFTLSNYLENLTLTGSGAINGTGSSLANIITGNSKNNILNTGGGVGINDTLFGGKGNDTYIVSNEFDVLVELSNEGTDLVLSRVSLTLDNNLENLTLVGSSTNATGNTLNNIIKGNSIANILDGGTAGTDTLSGLLGNDTYLINHSGVVITELAVQGTDLVKSSIDYTLGLNAENLTLTGNTATKAYGNILNNLITGNTLSNIISNGGGGKDTLIGANGNDTYVVTNTGVIITENSGQGTDLVESTISFSLSNEIENLTLAGSGAINGTGNSLTNIITGNSKNNVLSGKLNSLLGDTLIGGKGNDTYILGQIGDSFVEQLDEGTDLIISNENIWLADFANIENLTLIGSTATNATGTAVSNVIKGNSIANILDGGTAGTDTLLGLLGNDTYLINHSGVVITELAVQGTDLVKSSIDYTLGLNAENLTLTGTTATKAYGNILNNLITGNTLDNIISSGGGGKDTLVGGIGNDTYLITTTGITITENSGQGTDIIESNISYTLGDFIENLTLTGSVAINGIGNSLANIITGNSKNNSLKAGSAGDDTLLGGKGNDTYYIDHTGITAVENSGEGTDIIIAYFDYTLSDNIETLSLTSSALIGFGNSLSNTIAGNTLSNIISTGDGGADTLIGAEGNDTYIVKSSGVKITEYINKGTDIVEASVSYTMSNFIENLTLTGSSAIDGAGNSLANYIIGNSTANILSGLAGNDTIDGGTAGDDTLVGGTGNDTYLIDHTGVSITELTSQGTDIVFSSVSSTLSNNIENLTLSATGTINGFGNSLSNIIIGNSLANILYAGTSGKDTILAGIGDDSIGASYNDGNNYIDVSDGNDTITANYSTGNNTMYGGLGNDSLNINYSSGNNYINAGDGDDYIRSNTSSGNNILYGEIGNDYIYTRSSKGNDYIDSGDGNDYIDSSLSKGNNYITAGSGNDTIDAGTTYGNNTVFGGLGHDYIDFFRVYGYNNYIDGGAGDDTIYAFYGLHDYTIYGGLGNDSINVLQSRGVIYVDGGEGNDTINAKNKYFEESTLIGGAGDDYISIYNGSGKNFLDGGDGNDTISGSLSTDNNTLIGGAGDDSINFISSKGNNYIIGGDGADYIEMTDSRGFNTLIGGIGNDTIYGGWCYNQYIISANNDLDIVSSDAGGTNLIQISNVNKNSMAVFSNGTDLTISYATDNSDLITFKNYSSALFEFDDSSGYKLDSTVISAIIADITAYNSAHPGAINNVQDVRSAALTDVFGGLTLMQKIASEWTLNANNDNIISSTTGNETLNGGTGNDTYIINHTGVITAENAWINKDLVESAISYTLSDFYIENLTLTGSSAVIAKGNSLNNYITGNSIDNIFYDGANDYDTFAGGAGNDTYVLIDSSTIIENTNEGIDVIQMDGGGTIPNNIENFIMTGTGNNYCTGNSLSNLIIGNTANNTFYEYEQGNDTLIGGLGDDGYYFNHTGVTVIENGGEGKDWVTAFMDYTLDANIEQLWLNSGSSAVIGTGNSLSNYISGNSLNNILSGGSAGNDTLIGNIGNDTLMGASGNDQYHFSANHDIDIISSDSGGTNTVKITDVGKANIAVYNSGTDLILSYAADNTDIITIKNYATTISQIDDSAGLKLTSAQITAIINDIAAYNSVYPGAVNSVQDVRSTSFTDVAGFGGLTLMQKIASEWV